MAENLISESPADGAELVMRARAEGELPRMMRDLESWPVIGDVVHCVLVGFGSPHPIPLYDAWLVRS